MHNPIHLVSVPMRKKIKLKQGNNLIALLSATVGLKNYGPKFDTTPTGITGPIELISVRGDETWVKNLTLHLWSYTTGMRGIDHDMLFSDKSAYANKWNHGGQLLLNTSMTWYKTTFKAPLGKDPVVLNLTGMGKGAAWVNGNSIGRYWPSFTTDEDGCSLDPCDYRGEYDNNKCAYNCGKPTQIMYHVPRSFLNSGGNSLVLFEEFGGNPSQVHFQTMSISSACAKAYEGNTLELYCNGKPISAIKFASYGDPQGDCGSYQKGLCEGAFNAQQILTQACVGKEACLVDISDSVFGEANCIDKAKRLAVEIAC